jgi:mono/diheme cytochrome c family protein
MKTRLKPAFLFFPLFVFLLLTPIQNTIAQQTISLTPTYDPLVEPPLPENPTEFELGRNLYWHWCMTCHGDRGQGLTDEFRRIWEPEHQNCWSRGCHAGRPGEGGFPIPTVVPALVDETCLVQFASVQELSDFLKATHPPQSPGILKNEEYHAIALFVFSLNGRSLTDMPAMDAPVPTSEPTLMSLKTTSPNDFPVYVIIVFVGLSLMVGMFALARRAHFPG